uniref:[histone H3]-dimethyl-L-lysine(36) demethylase n=1 Tax=Strigamia maritima TaxID=126957 RepID=T1IVH5_STRMM
MANVPVYCLCGQPYDATRFMIQCDVCREWFHGSCVHLREHQSNDIEKYHCPKCTKIFGPSMYKQRTNWHRHDYTEEHADKKAVQTGTPVFIAELKSRHFPPADEVLLKLPGHKLTLPYLIQNGFNTPILVNDKSELGLRVPPEHVSIDDIVSLIGPEREIDVIDVGKQDNIHMMLQEFVEYFKNTNKRKILNLISLEFSNTRLSDLVEAPSIVKKISWVNSVWPNDLPKDSPYIKPEVEKYCLIGVSDSFTDFHVDFGGTSVWYHVLKGEKIFYLIRPTAANLTLYEQWMSSSNQSETFFGDQVDRCYRCAVNSGQTLFIPTGWIHSVFTPIESLVFGGNFLHDFNISLQFQIYELERRAKTPEKYRFPRFELINWFAAKHILEQLKSYNDKLIKPPIYLLAGVKSLIASLKMWTQNKDLLKIHKMEIPTTIQHTKLIKDLNKEFRHGEKHVQGQVKDDKKKKAKVKQTDKLNINNSQNTNREENQIQSVQSEVDDMKQWSLKLTLPKKTLEPDKLTLPVKHPSSPKVLPESPFKLWLNKTGTPENKRNGMDLKLKLPKTNNKLKRSGNLDKKTSGKKPSKVSTLRLKNDAVNALKKDDSIYDFRDSDDDGLIVDENPKTFSQNRIKHEEKEKPASLKLQISLNGKTVVKQNAEVDNSQSDIDITSFNKNSGIDDLLRASGYAIEPAENKLEDELGNGRASPSTREAIQGMLSIGCAVQFSTLTSNSSRLSSSGGNTGTSTRSQRQRKFILSDDVGENMSKCHQDDEYVYPTLDESDDDIHVFKPRGRAKKDEPWNPKGSKTAVLSAEVIAIETSCGTRNPRSFQFSNVEAIRKHGLFV